MALAFVHLTADAIGRLAPGEKVTEFGIVAERLADGDVEYSVDARIHGRRVHHVIGRESDGIGAADAGEFIAAARAEAAASPGDGADQLIEVEVQHGGTTSTVLRARGATADPSEAATDAPVDDEHGPRGRSAKTTPEQIPSGQASPGQASPGPSAGSGDAHRPSAEPRDRPAARVKRNRGSQQPANREKRKRRLALWLFLGAVAAGGLWYGLADQRQTPVVVEALAPSHEQGEDQPDGGPASDGQSGSGAGADASGGGSPSSAGGGGGGAQPYPTGTEDAARGQDEALSEQGAAEPTASPDDDGSRGQPQLAGGEEEPAADNPLSDGARKQDPPSDDNDERPAVSSAPEPATGGSAEPKPRSGEPGADEPGDDEPGDDEPGGGSGDPPPSSGGSSSAEPSSTSPDGDAPSSSGGGGDGGGGDGGGGDGGGGDGGGGDGGGGDGGGGDGGGGDGGGGKPEPSAADPQPSEKAEPPAEPSAPLEPGPKEPEPPVEVANECTTGSAVEERDRQARLRRLRAALADLPRLDDLSALAVVDAATIVAALTTLPPLVEDSDAAATPGRRLAKPSIDLGIRFEFDLARISAASLVQLGEVAKALLSPLLQGLRIMVEGHTDAIGSDGYNLALSERRAVSVRQTLTEPFAIRPERLAIRGMGETAPVDTNQTPEGRRHNRRVTFINLGECPAS